MAKYGSNEVKIEIKNGSDSYKDISANLDGNIDIQKEALTEEVHGYGEEWVKHGATGLKQMSDITISGWYDDADNNTHELLNREGEKTSIKVTWNVTTGTPHTTEIPVIIQSYRRLAQRGQLTKVEAVLRLAGTPVETP